jgi:hypothetical protein
MKRKLNTLLGAKFAPRALILSLISKKKKVRVITERRCKTRLMINKKMKVRDKK